MVKKNFPNPPGCISCLPSCYCSVFCMGWKLFQNYQWTGIAKRFFISVHNNAIDCSIYRFLFFSVHALLKWGPLFLLSTFFSFLSAVGWEASDWFLFSKLGKCCRWYVKYRELQLYANAIFCLRVNCELTCNPHKLTIGAWCSSLIFLLMYFVGCIVSFLSFIAPPLYDVFSPWWCNK